MLYGGTPPKSPLIDLERTRYAMRYNDVRYDDGKARAGFCGPMHESVVVVGGAQ